MQGEYRKGQYRNWEVKLIRERYEELTQLEIAAKLNRPPSSVKNWLQRNGLKKVTNPTSFKLGNNPWNKGLSGVKWIGGDTKFKTGNIPKNARKDGELFLRREHKKTIWYIKPIGQRNVVPYHRYRWQQINGEIPTSHVIFFADGNPMNIKDENIILIHRSELLKRNRQKNDLSLISKYAWDKRRGGLLRSVLMGNV